MNAGNATSAGTQYTATLIRGRVYTFERVQYARSVPKPVSKETAEKLKELVDHKPDLDPDGDGIGVDRPLFKIERIRMQEAVLHKTGKKKKFKLRGLKRAGGSF